MPKVITDEKKIAKESAITAGLATIAIFVRFFVVVDIVINLFGKINVELGTKIQNIVTFLQNLQFPTLGFAQKSSLINDGGDEAIKNWHTLNKNLLKNDTDNSCATTKNEDPYLKTNKTLAEVRFILKFCLC